MLFSLFWVILGGQNRPPPEISEKSRKMGGKIPGNPRTLGVPKWGIFWGVARKNVTNYPWNRKKHKFYSAKSQNLQCKNGPPENRRIFGGPQIGIGVFLDVLSFFTCFYAFLHKKGIFLAFYRLFLCSKWLKNTKNRQKCGKIHLFRDFWPLFPPLGIG